MLSAVLGVAFDVLLLTAATTTWLGGWTAGPAILGVTSVGRMIDPLLRATLFRARDRFDAAEYHRNPPMSGIHLRGCWQGAKRPT